MSFPLLLYDDFVVRKAIMFFLRQKSNNVMVWYKYLQLRKILILIGRMAHSEHICVLRV